MVIFERVESDDEDEEEDEDTDCAAGSFHTVVRNTGTATSPTVPHTGSDSQRRPVAVKIA